MKNYKFRYSHKSDKSLKNSISVYKLVTNSFFVAIAKRGLKLAKFFKIPIKPYAGKVYSQFCGGANIKDLIEKARELAEYNIKIVPAFSVEEIKSESFYEKVTNEVCEAITYVSGNDNFSFAVFKPTALIRPEILDRKSKLYKYEKDLRAFADRLDRIFSYAEKHSASVLVDAEEYKYQKNIDDIFLEFVRKYNRVKPTVFITIQFYLKEKEEYFKDLVKIAREEKLKLGVKFVRGAYLEKEQKLAKKYKYENPLQPDKESTDKAFNNALKYALDNIDIVDIFCATHNYDSVELLCNEMKTMNITNSDNRIYFSQLYGMRDNLSFYLAENKYNITKYVPYGPLKRVIPYLIRRAEENSSINMQAVEELDLMKQEYKRRLD